MELTLAQKIENLTWWNEIIKLKDILRSLLGYVPAYKTYTALMTQSGTNPPTALILSNTTGQTITWTYSGIGEYVGTFSGTIDQNKLWFSTHANFESSTDVHIIYASTNTIELKTFREFLEANGKLTKTSIEIRIYN